MSSVMNDRLPRHRITVEEYYRMAEEGLLKPDVRHELIEGEIIEMAPMGSPHAAEATDLMYLFVRSLGSSALVRVQMPVRLDTCSEPEPDVAVVRPRQDSYRTQHPTADDVILLVEVSDSSSSRDRKRKIPLYARYGVPEVWIVDVARRQLHVYRSPKDGVYSHSSPSTVLGPTPLSALPGALVDLSSLFGTFS
jgi:Uma2 family endonuclease